MSRTRLRGLEIGGIQIGIEVPASCAWDWPDPQFAAFSCLPRDPEVHVGLRVGRVAGEDLAGEHYTLGEWTFEVARRGEDWVLGLSRAGRRESLAVFDGDFSAGEIVLAWDSTGRPDFPLRSPLDEWIVLHRNVARGGLCLNARAIPHRGRARVQMGADRDRGRFGGPVSRTTLLGRNTLWLRAEEGEPRVYRTPWDDSMDRQLGCEARVVDFVVCEESEIPYREVLDPTDAADLLATHAVVPICDEGLLERVLRNARRLGERLPVRRIGGARPMSERTTWSSPAFQNGLAPPRIIA